MKLQDPGSIPILVVEDDPATNLLVKRMLIGAGFAQTQGVYSATEAFASVAESHPSIILMDINLGATESGIDVATELNAKYDIPVIYMTAYSSKALLQEAGLTAPYGYLVKPVHQDTMLATVYMALYKHHLDCVIKESEERYRVLSEVISDYMYEFDMSPEGTIYTRWINDAFSKAIGGRKPGIDPYGYWQSLILPEDRLQYAAHLEKLKSGEKSTCDYRIISSQDGTRWIRDYSKPSWTDSGMKTIRIHGAAQDITASRKIENDFYTSEAQLTGVLDSAKDAIFIKDISLRFVIVNSALAKLYGKERSDFPGHTISEFVDSKAASEYAEIERRVLKGAVVEHEHEVPSGSGTVHMQSITTPLQNRRGEIIGICGVMRDVTERALAERALIESEEKLRILNAGKDQLFSIVAHDMRGPFTTVLGFMEILHGDYSELSDEERTDYITIVLRSIQNLYRLIDNLLQWSRIQTGRIKSIQESLSVFLEVRDSIELVLVMAQEKNIAIDVTIDRKMMVLTDREHFRTVMRNLLSNAVKFTHRGGRIVVAAAERNDMIDITVQDNGIGMTKESIDQLFNSNGHYSTAGTSQEQGTGLGLYLCRELIELMHGTISIKSIPNVGSTFTVTLPLPE
jgi:PAS domain S-box-containing protein